MFNKVIVVGRVVRKPILNDNGKLKIANFTLASSFGKTTDFIPCVAFQKNAEIISQYVDKGKLLLVEGRFSSSSFERDGKTQYRSSVVISSFKFLDRRNATTDVPASTPDNQPDELTQEMMENLKNKIVDESNSNNGEITFFEDNKESSNKENSGHGSDDDIEWEL